MAAKPLHVVLSDLSAQSREGLARERLTPEAVRKAATDAALKGLNVATLPLGPANLERTEAAREIARTLLKGCTLEWVESIGRDGVSGWELRVCWPLASAAPAASPNKGGGA